MQVLELNKINLSTYKIVDESETKVIRCKTKIVTKNESKTYLIYSDDNNISDKSNFISFHMDGVTPASRLIALYALRLLEIFETIIQTKLEKFTPNQIKQFVMFLRGISFDADEIKYELITERSNKTVNQYLGVYRKYLKYLNVDKHLLLENKLINKSRDFSRAYQKYNYTLKTNLTQLTAPRYISATDFKEILKANEEVDDEVVKLRNKIMLYLMFQYGMRIGEVLSLTFEDITVTELPYYETGEVNEETGELICEFKECCILTLRNRFDSKKGTGCKNLMVPTNRRSYNTKDYQTKGKGYDEQLIGMELYNLIEDYKLSSLQKYRANEFKQYVNNSKADSIEFYKLNKIQQEQILKSKTLTKKYYNRYLFLNKFGGKLNIENWNRDLKKLFIKANLTTDEKKKIVGLSHRFRHGYTMARIAQGANPKMISKELRHRNIDSINAYYNPTTTDIIKMKNNMNIFENLLNEQDLDKLAAQQTLAAEERNTNNERREKKK